MPTSAEDFVLIWRNACHLMARRKGSEARQWVDQLRLCSIKDGRATFIAETALARDWADTKLDNEIRDGLAEASGLRINSLDVVLGKSFTAEGIQP